jgi:RNA recognition motif-containing protein
MKIFVDNLSFEIMDDFVRAAFEQFGQVASAVIAREHNSSDSRGYAFVEMPAEAEARAAIEGMNGKEMMGRPIEVTEARPDSEARRNRSANTRKEPRTDRAPDRHRQPEGRRRAIGSVSTAKSRYGKLG